MPWWESHASRLQAAAVASDLARTRELALGEHRDGYPSTTGPIGSWGQVLEERHPRDGRPHGNSHVRALERMSMRAAGQHLGATVAASSWFGWAITGTLEMSTPSWPVPTGRTATAIERHLSDAGGRNDERTWQRWRRNTLAPALDDLALVGITAQSPAAASRRRLSDPRADRLYGQLLARPPEERARLAAAARQQLRK